MSEKKKKRVVIEIAVGGSGLAAVRASNAHVILAIDASSELQQAPDMPNLIKVACGEQDTVLTLLERSQDKCPEARALLEEYHKVPNVHLSDGMAQDPRLGRLAVKDLWLRGELDPVFEEILKRMLEVTNGQLELIEVRELNSNAGGMGSGGAPEVGELFIRWAAVRTEAKFEHRMFRFGGLGHATIAKRAIGNAAERIESNLNSALECADPRRTYSLELAELPLRNEAGLPLRDNRELRAALTGALIQARFSKKVTLLVDASEVNFKTTHPLGGVHRVQADWSEFIDQEALKRAAATHFRNTLKALREQPEPPDLTVAVEATVELSDQDSPLPSVEAVMHTINQNRAAAPAVLEQMVKAPLQRFTGAVRLKTPQDQLITMDQALGGTPDRPQSLTEVRAYSQRWRGVIAHLEQAHRAAEQEQQEAGAQLERQRRKLARESKSLGAIPTLVAEIIRSRKQVRQSRQAILKAFCDAHRRASEWHAKAEAMARALRQARTDLASYEELWIGRIGQPLEEAIGNRLAFLDTVKFASLDDIYPMLLDVALRGANELMQPLLLRAVSQVTLKGLGQMLGTEADPQAIIGKLEEESFTWGSPPWGGGIIYAPPRHRFVVFPPLAAGDLADLERAAQELGFTATLATADSVAAGCCIVRLSFFPVAKREDVITQLYAGARMNPGLNGLGALRSDTVEVIA